MSPLSELQHKFGGKGKDLTHRNDLMQTPRVERWNNADFEKMAEYTGFQN